MFFGIVILGLLHGLLFLPVYLGIFGRWSKRFQTVTSNGTRVNTKDGLDNYGSDTEDNQGREAIEFQPVKSDNAKKTVKDNTENTTKF